MAIKGAEAKAYAADRIKEAFGQDFIGEIDKKLYVWSMENGSRKQVAISLTCPNVPIEYGSAVGGGSMNFEQQVAAPASAPPAELTQQEKDNIQQLLASLV